MVSLMISRITLTASKKSFHKQSEYEQYIFLKCFNIRVTLIATLSYIFLF